MMTSLLLNDIDAFAKRYSRFRIQNKEYFDLSQQEVDQKENTPVIPVTDSSSSASSFIVNDI